MNTLPMSVIIIASVVSGLFMLSGILGLTGVWDKIFPTKAQQAPLKRLRALRASGVILRNEAMSPKSEEEAQFLIKRIDIWLQEVLTIIQKKSQIEVTYFEILDNYSPKWEIKNKTLEKPTNEMTERLNRLLEIMRRWDK